jgi:hypothetical protein
MGLQANQIKNKKINKTSFFIVKFKGFLGREKVGFFCEEKKRFFKK